MLNINLQKIDSQKPTETPLLTFLEGLGLVLLATPIETMSKLNLEASFLASAPVYETLTLSLVTLIDGSMYIVADHQGVVKGRQYFKEL